MTFRIVITGAPASGKSEFIERLKNEPEFVQFEFLGEMARQLLEENPGYRNDWAEFHHEIYRRQTAREKALDGKSFVTDRGTLDAFAFHPETAGDVNTTIENEYTRYDAVIHLGSSASLGEEYYQRDNIRNESIDEAMAIERAITGVWSGHSGYRFILADNDMEEKYHKFFAAICALIRKPK